MHYAVPIALLIALHALPATADERAAFYGTWGTEKQCARAPIKPGGTVLEEPFEIGAEWLRQGSFWCRLNWFPIEPRGDDVFTAAHAQCGEDSTRDYVLGMELAGGKLKLRWEFPLSNGPLGRCGGN